MESLEGCLKDIVNAIIAIVIVVLTLYVLNCVVDTRQRVKYIEQMLIETTDKQLK